MKFAIGFGFVLALISCQPEATPEGQVGERTTGGAGGTDVTGGTGATDQGGTGGTQPPVVCSDSEPCSTETKPVCSAEGVCAACSENIQCQTLSPTKPICGRTGTCVECKAHSDCKNPTKPACGSDGTCGKCTDSFECVLGRRDGKACQQSTGLCVACVGDNDCFSTTPICKDNVCVACGAASPNACSAKNSAFPACAGSGQCVACTSTTTQACTGSKPFCHVQSSTCGRCRNDFECKGQGPEVCMDHDDGRCATDAETVGVLDGNLQGAIDQVTAGTKKVIVFGGEVGPGLFPGPGTLVLVGKETFTTVRQKSTDANAPAALRLTGGTTYARRFHVRFSPGGILVDGGGFDFREIEVSDNTPGKFGATTWGGVLVNNPGTPAKISSASIERNREYGLVCSTSIDIDASVVAYSNVGGDIDPRCRR